MNEKITKRIKRFLRGNIVFLFALAIFLLTGNFLLAQSSLNGEKVLDFAGKDADMLLYFNSGNLLNSSFIQKMTKAYPKEWEQINKALDKDNLTLDDLKFAALAFGNSSKLNPMPELYAVINFEKNNAEKIIQLVIKEASKEKGSQKSKQIRIAGKEAFSLNIGNGLSAYIVLAKKNQIQLFVMPETREPYKLLTPQYNTLTHSIKTKSFASLIISPKVKQSEMAEAIQNASLEIGETMRGDLLLTVEALFKQNDFAKMFSSKIKNELEHAADNNQLVKELSKNIKITVTQNNLQIQSSFSPDEFLKSADMGLQNARNKAKASVCMSQLKQIGLAIKMYQSDNNENLPGMGKKGFERLLKTGFLPPNVLDKNLKKNDVLTEKVIPYILLDYARQTADRYYYLPICFDKPGLHEETANSSHFVCIDGSVGIVKFKYRNAVEFANGYLEKNKDIPAEVGNLLKQAARSYDETH